MKRYLFTALMLLATGSLSTVLAQGSRQYDDDIYGGKPSQPKEEQQTPSSSRSSQMPRDEEQRYSSSDNGSSQNNGTGQRQYSSDEYYDSDDDYNYSSRINRFNYPFYNRPYWSSFNNPYWYDPFWVDPYWGWSPWTRPGLNISFGMGPYWSSYWGWNSWYGYSGFGSYWGNPWGGGFGGWGGGFGGFYSGYWNGYYAGLYNGYGRGDGYFGGGGGRSITYGPRYNLRPRSESANGAIRNNNGYNGFRTSNPRQGNVTGAATQAAGGRQEGFRTMSPGTRGSALPERETRSNEAPVRNQGAPSNPTAETRPMRNGWREDNINRGSQATSPEQPRQERNVWSDRNQQQQQAPPAGRTVEAPRVQEQRTYSAPQPRYESAPSRSFDRGGGGFGGGRSFGGGGGGGGFGGGGGGRRR